LFSAFSDAIRDELSRRGHAFFLSLSALKVTHQLSLAGGALPVGPLHPVGLRSPRARVLDGLRGLASRAPVIWRYSGQTTVSEHAARFFRRLDEAGNGTGGLTVGRQARPTEQAALVASLPHDGRIRRHRDAAWFAWRYRNPLHDYRFVYAEKGSRLRGYLIVERSVSDMANSRRAHIVDWEADTPEVAESLLRHVLTAGQPMELVTWVESAGNAGVRALAGCGFCAVDEPHTAQGMPSILLWPVTLPAEPGLLRLGKRSLLELDNWDLRIADTSYG
jgi:hypothetical protein